MSEQIDSETLREAMEDLRLPSSGPKLHWSAESTSRRMEIIETVAALPLEGLIVVRQGPTDDRDERRRRKCLEHLLCELDAWGCATLTLESRGRADDHRDMQVLQFLRQAHRLPSGVRLDHKPGPADAALWIADALCGAVTQERQGDGRFLKVVEKRVSVQLLEA
ncbi:hypothetical protein QOZ86_03675 [Blastococcus capsensis]|nr:hypothetical protein [Blastococcus capsensis]